MSDRVNGTGGVFSGIRFGRAGAVRKNAANDRADEGFDLTQTEEAVSAPSFLSLPSDLLNDEARRDLLDDGFSNDNEDAAQAALNRAVAAYQTSTERADTRMRLSELLETV